MRVQLANDETELTKSRFLSLNNCSLTWFYLALPARLTQGIRWHGIKMSQLNLELRQTNLLRYQKSTLSNLGY